MVKSKHLSDKAGNIPSGCSNFADVEIPYAKEHLPVVYPIAKHGFHHLS